MITGQGVPFESTVSAAFRAWTEPTTPKRVGKRTPTKPIRDVLVIDTETTTDTRQSLTFGTWVRATVAENGTVTRIAEGIFHADDLAVTDPDGYAILRRHCESNNANVHDTRNSHKRINFSNRTDFVNDIMWKFVDRTHGTVVMFNKPFDMSRIAYAAGEAGRDNYGHFVFDVFRKGPYTQRVRVKHLDSKRSFMSLAAPQYATKGGIKGGRNHGEFLDLRTWIFALTNSAVTLASGCDMFHTEHRKMETDTHGIITDDYVRYARMDALATTDLFEALYAEHRKHPVELAPTKSYSSASVAKAYLAGMGVKPRRELDRESFTPEVLGQCMESFYGARAECRIRHTPVPVEVHDFTSMYPTVNSLMGLWSLLTAERITADDATDDVREFVDGVTLDTMFDRSSWPALVGIVELKPNGDILPVRAKYRDDETHTIGVNPVWSDTPHWYTIADAVASKILTGKTPEIIRAVRFVPHGTLRGLKSIRIRGTLTVNPRTTDFFRNVVEERQRVRSGPRGDDCTRKDNCACDVCKLSAFLKVLANAGSYGIFSQMDAEDRAPDDPDTVRVFDGRRDEYLSQVPGAEIPGVMCFPPIATCITGAARLMLSMLEKSVTNLGGSWVFCDTDSLAIVATDDGRNVECVGGSIRDTDGTEYVHSLTYDQTKIIRDRFNELSPYDLDAVPHVLKIEYKATCLAISTKRYACYVEDSNGVNVTKYSEHGLGHVMSPTGTKRTAWIREYWTWRIATHLGYGVERPEWFGTVAVTSIAVSSPMLWRAFRHINEGKDYADQIKPFSFMVAPLRVFGGAGEGRLVAAFETLPEKWDTLDWLDVKTLQTRTIIGSTAHDGSKLSMMTSQDTSRDGQVRPVAVKEYADIIDDAWRHPEAKFNGPDGEPCQTLTTGLLQRRNTHVGVSRVVGKESNKIEDVTSGVIRTEQILTYRNTTDDAIRSGIMGVFTGMTDQAIADAVSSTRVSLRDDVMTSITHDVVRRFRTGRGVADDARHAMTVTAARKASNDLDDLDTQEGHVPMDRLVLDDTLVILEWVRRIGTPVRLCVCGCGATVTGTRARFAMASCRLRSHRDAQRTA